MGTEESKVGKQLSASGFCLLQCTTDSIRQQVAFQVAKENLYGPGLNQKYNDALDTVSWSIAEFPDGIAASKISDDSWQIDRKFVNNCRSTRAGRCSPDFAKQTANLQQHGSDINS